jgi:V-type H+-transporting ATPase subunit A
VLLDFPRFQKNVIYGGTVIGYVPENELIHHHYIMVPPLYKGRCVSLQPHGHYTLDDTIMVIQHPDTGETADIKLSHYWPVRRARPVQEKLPASEPLLTGQRVLDSLFPSVLGGTCAIPGAFGCGKTCISQALSKHSNTSCVVYVGCGERGMYACNGNGDGTRPQRSNTHCDGSFRNCADAPLVFLLCGCR